MLQARLPLLLTWRRVALLLLAGSVGGALCDQIHVQFGVLAYPRHDVFGQAWWVGPNFGLATLVMYAATWLWASRCERAQPGPVTDREVIQHTAWFLGAYVASALLQGQPKLLALVYGLLFLRRVLPRADAPWLALHGVGLAIGGTSFEAVLAATGAFHYNQPDLWTVPLWLPGVYLHGAPLAMAVLRRMRTGAQQDAPLCQVVD